MHTWAHRAAVYPQGSIQFPGWSAKQPQSSNLLSFLWCCKLCSVFFFSLPLHAPFLRMLSTVKYLLVNPEAEVWQLYLWLGVIFVVTIWYLDLFNQQFTWDPLKMNAKIYVLLELRKKKTPKRTILSIFTSQESENTSEVLIIVSDAYKMLSISYYCYRHYFYPYILPLKQTMETSISQPLGKTSVSTISRTDSITLNRWGTVLESPWAFPDHSLGISSFSKQSLHYCLLLKGSYVSVVQNHYKEMCCWGEGVLLVN